MLPQRKLQKLLPKHKQLLLNTSFKQTTDKAYLQGAPYSFIVLLSLSYIDIEELFVLHCHSVNSSISSSQGLLISDRHKTCPQIRDSRAPLEKRDDSHSKVMSSKSLPDGGILRLQRIKYAGFKTLNLTKRHRAFVILSEKGLERKQNDKKNDRIQGKNCGRSLGKRATTVQSYTKYYTIY